MKNIKTKKIVKAVCVVCGKEFPKYIPRLNKTPKSIYARKHNSVTCSMECSKVRRKKIERGNSRKKYKELRMKNIKTKKIVKAVCVVCGKEFPRYIPGLNQTPRSIYARKHNSVTCSMECSKNRKPLNSMIWKQNNKEKNGISS